VHGQVGAWRDEIQGCSRSTVDGFENQDGIFGEDAGLYIKKGHGVRGN